MENFKLNDRVVVLGKNTKGKIAYIGQTQFADGVMFGVILDEPKGKYTGTIEDVCYFKCKRNHGTFVRACQLAKDSDYPLEDYRRPAYPNYLKESSSKHGLKTQEKPKSENSNKEIQGKTPDSTNIDVSRSGKLMDEIFQKGDSLMDKTSQQICFDESKKKLENPSDVLEELAVTKQKLSEMEKQMEAVHSYLRMLKTYLKWNEENEKSTKPGDDRTGNLLQLLMDNVIKKIEDTVRRAPKNKHSKSSIDDSSVLTEENNFLLLCVGVLEKRNAILTESLTHVKDILQRSCSRSRSTKCTETTDEEVHSKNRCENCLSKRSFRDIIEHETRLFLKSNPAIKPKPTESSINMLDGFKGSEKVKKYLETLFANKEISNQENIKFPSPKVEKNIQHPDRLKISTSENAVSQKILTPKVSLKRKDIVSNSIIPIRRKTQPSPVPQSRKCPSEINQRKFPFGDLKDPAKELKEFISEMVSNATVVEESQSSGVHSKPLTGSVQKPKERDSSMIGDCPAQSTSNKTKGIAKFQRKTVPNRK